MATGKMLFGVCYPTDQEVIQALASKYPVSDNGEIWYLKDLPVLAGNNLSYTVWSGKSNVQDSVTVTALNCETSVVPADPLFTVVMFAACAVMFGLGFIGTR